VHIAGRACARPGLVPRVAQRHEKTDTTRRGYADHLGTDAPRKPRRTPNTTHPQFYHDLITMRGLCRHTWERTHTITLNTTTTPVPPWKILLLLEYLIVLLLNIHNIYISYNNSKQKEVFLTVLYICLNETILTCKFRRY
jgi:hypothetical protein